MWRKPPANSYSPDLPPPRQFSTLLGRGHRKSTVKHRRQLAGVLLYRPLRLTRRELETCAMVGRGTRCTHRKGTDRKLPTCRGARLLSTLLARGRRGQPSGLLYPVGLHGNGNRVITRKVG